MVLERARTDQLAQDIKQLHDELIDVKRRAGQARREAESKGADGCPLASFTNVFKLTNIPEGWHVIDPPETELRAWAKDQIGMHLVAGTPYSQDATPRHRTAVLDSFGWVGRISVGYSLEFTYMSCAFSLVGEGVSQSEVELFGGLLRAS